MTVLEPNTDEAMAFLAATHAGRLCVLTAIGEDIADKKTVFTSTFEPTPEGNRMMRRWIEQRQNKANIYYTLNSVEKLFQGGQKPKKSDIVAANFLHVDIDPKQGCDIASEQARILALLSGYRLRPTVIVFSGGGYQALWKLSEPFPLKGEADIAKIESYNRKLQSDLGGDNTHNVDRLLRLPGTINVLDANKLKKGRAPALARVVPWN